MKPTVSIVIPVFGPEHFLTACLSAISNNTPDIYELILVDNATGYDMVNAPNLQALVRNTENQGFAKACNAGAKCARSEILCFLNVDTEVQPGWLEPLVAALDDTEIAMVGPKIIHPNGSIQTTGIRTWHGTGQAGGEEIKADLPSRDVDGVTGACMVVRKEVYSSCGGFCDQYWLGYEDVDLCLTVSEAGHRIHYIAESQIIHHESATGPERWSKTHENVALMNQRWGAC